MKKEYTIYVSKNGLKQIYKQHQKREQVIEVLTNLMTDEYKRLAMFDSSFSNWYAEVQDFKKDLEHSDFINKEFDFHNGSFSIVEE